MVVSFEDQQMKTIKTGAGFSLVELMVAVAVLSIGLITVITAILASIQLERQSRELTMAKNASELQMQFLRGLPYSGATDGNDIIAHLGANATWSGDFAVNGLRPAPNDTDGSPTICGWFSVTKRAGSVNNNLVDITVRVQWRGGRGGPQIYEMVGMKSDRGTRYQAP